MSRKGSYRFFGDEFLKPKSAEPIKPEKELEQKKEPAKEEKENRPKKFQIFSLVGWLVAVICAIIALYFFNLYSKEKQEKSAITTDSLTLKESLSALLSSPPNLDSAILFLKALSESDTEIAKWAKEVVLKTGSLEAYRLKVFSTLAAATNDAELERALGARLVKLAEDRMRGFSTSRIQNLLGEERFRSLVTETLGKMSDSEIATILLKRQDTLTRIFVEKMGDERFESLFGDKLLSIFRQRMDRFSSNLTALETLLGKDLLANISKTYLNSSTPENLVPAVEDNFERLSEAVQKWRKEHTVKVKLKNGESLEGILLNRTENELLLRTKEGKKTVLMNDVDKIEKSDGKEEKKGEEEKEPKKPEEKRQNEEDKVPD